MAQYSLADSYASAFTTALDADDPVAMLQSITDAALANKWPNYYRPSMRVGSFDPAWMAATRGNIECFVALTKFIFTDQSWLNCTPHHRDGRISRFPLDVAELIKVRMDQLAAQPDAGTDLRQDLSRCFFEYLSQPNGDVHALAKDLDQRLPESLAAALGHAKGKLISEVEREQLDAAIATVSEAVRRSVSRL